MKESLQADGVENVELWFIQIGTQEKTPQEVAELIGETPAPVLADDLDQTLWTAFASTWYEAVLLDPEDCIVAKFGPFSPDPPEPDEIIPLWRGAALGTLPCDEPTPDTVADDPARIRPDPDPVPDVVETGPDVTDAVETADTSEIIDPLEDLHEDIPADVPPDLPADLPPDIPSELPPEPPEVPPGWCQVPGSPAPAGPGDPLPPFTCVDLNPASPANGAVVSRASLKERVWLAYAGSGG